VPFKSKDYQRNPPAMENRVQSIIRLFELEGDVFYPPQRTIYQRIADLTKDRTVLDVGCGTGHGTYLLGDDAVGLDINSSSIAFAKCLYSRNRFTTSSISSLRSKSFDVVVAIEVVEHVMDAQKFIDDCLMVATKMVYFSTPNQNNPGLGDEKPHNRLHVEEFTSDEMLEMLPKGTVVRDSNWDIVSLVTETTPLIYEVTL
jgi:2-polyprenyl-3-methyl-5-hydroxy-6-metoxy-1,4-benzoquinol methylase